MIPVRSTPWHRALRAARSAAVLVTLGLPALPRPCAGAAPAASPPAAASPAPAPDIDRIVDDLLAARGGADRLRAVRSMRITGRITRNGSAVGTFVFERQRPNRFRSAVHTNEGDLVEGSDGTTVWRQGPQDDAPKVVRGDESKPLLDKAEFDAQFLDWRQRGYRLALEGREKVGTVQAWKVKVTTPRGAVSTVLIDEASHLPLRERSTLRVPQATLTLENAFSDWRTVKGMLYPFRSEQSVEVPVQGRQVQVQEITSVEVDPALDEARFRLPAGAK
jgi:hypothetical protein